jgi:hypothetical protein
MDMEEKEDSTVLQKDRESKRKIEAREQDGSLTEYEAGILATVREQ